MQLIVFPILLVVLAFLSTRLTKLLSQLLYKWLKSQAAAIYILSFLFLPGVVVHELSHLLFANILFVRTGEVEFFPELHGNEVKMGSVAVAKTDPFRRFFIGVAPLVGGLAVMMLVASYFALPLLSWKSIVLLYVVFQIVNTMFSSRKDMEGAIGLALGVVLVLGVLQLLGVPIVNLLIGLGESNEVVQTAAVLNGTLLFAFGVDVFAVLLLEGLVRIKVHR